MSRTARPGGSGLGNASKRRAEFSDSEIDSSEEECAESTKKKQKRKPITSITLRSLTFLSDHAVLQDYDTDWEDGGQTYAAPDWTSAKQNPISHTGGETVGLCLSLRVAPQDADTSHVDITGKVQGSTIRFYHSGNLGAGDFTIDVTSNKALPKKVQTFAMNIDWTFTWADGNSATTTQNPFFITLGDPWAPNDCPGITLERMREAVRAVGLTNTTQPHSIVNQLMSQFANYNLNVALDNAWELADDLVTGADCQTIVRYVRQVISMVGCPGTATFVVVWGRTGAPATGVVTRDAYTPNGADPKQWRDHRQLERATLVDLNGGRNRYEACLEFDHGGRAYFYAGGVGRKNNADDVLHAFFAMCWMVDAGGGITDIHHRYRRPAQNDTVFNVLPQRLHQQALA